MAADSFDKARQSVMVRCAVCRWPFRCPIEQLRRVVCSACESIAKEIMENNDALQPTR